MHFSKREGGERNNIRFKLHASLVSNFIHVSLVTETLKMEKATKSEVKKKTITVESFSRANRTLRLQRWRETTLLRKVARASSFWWWKNHGNVLFLGRGNRNEFERTLEWNRKEGGTMEKGIFFFSLSLCWRCYYLQSVTKVRHLKINIRILAFFFFEWNLYHFS